jgi:hypothetical protein
MSSKAHNWLGITVLLAEEVDGGDSLIQKHLLLVIGPHGKSMLRNIHSGSLQPTSMHALSCGSQRVKG